MRVVAAHCGEFVKFPNPMGPETVTPTPNSEKLTTDKSRIFTALFSQSKNTSNPPIPLLFSVVGSDPSAAEILIKFVKVSGFVPL